MLCVEREGEYLYVGNAVILMCVWKPVNTITRQCRPQKLGHCLAYGKKRSPVKTKDHMIRNSVNNDRGVVLQIHHAHAAILLELSMEINNHSGHYFLVC